MTHQIKALYKFGFRTLINVVSEDISMSSPETRIGIELEEERSYAGFFFFNSFIYLSLCESFLLQT